MSLLLRTVLCATALSLAASCFCADQPTAPHFIDVFAGGQDGYPVVPLYYPGPGPTTSGRAGGALAAT